MKAAVYREAGKPLVLETLPDPVPGPGDVIIRVHRCGICGTDLHMTEGHQWQFSPGTVPGHEYSGEIVEIGANVTGFRAGDLITALPSTGCGHCEACHHGNLALCHNAPGVMAEMMRIPASVAIKLPATLSAADGALIEPLAVGLYGVRMSGIQPGDRVLVMGAGAVALCTIYWARRLGAGRIVAMSRSARRQALALEMGADAFVGLAADAVGGANALLELTVEHLQVRRQFGRPLALFQALKHRCADLKTLIAAAEALLLDSLGRLGDAIADAEAELKAETAKYLASSTYAKVAEEALQLHGGIGMAAEHQCHLFLKRALLNEQLGRQDECYALDIADSLLARLD